MSEDSTYEGYYPEPVWVPPEAHPHETPPGMVLVGWWHAKSSTLTRNYPHGYRVTGGDHYELCPILPVFAPDHDHGRCFSAHSGGRPNDG